MKSAVFLLSALVSLAQTNPVVDGLQRGMKLRLEKERLEMERQYLDLAKQANRRAQEEHTRANSLAEIQEPQDLRSTMIRQLRSHNSLSEFQAIQALEQSFAALRTRHPDFDRLLPAMELIVRAIPPSLDRIKPEDYLEAMYAVVRTASFTAGLRQELLGQH